MDHIFLTPGHSFEQREGEAPAGSLGEAAQHRRRVLRVGVPVSKEAAIEDQNGVYPDHPRVRPLYALEPASQVLQNDKRRKVEGDQRRGLDG